MKYLSVILMILAITCSATAVALAQPPLMSYQGRLTDTLGQPLDTVVDLTFRIYADESGTVELWSETVPGVAIEGGLFTVFLGDGNPIPDTALHGGIVFLGTAVDAGPELAPLVALVSVPYAMKSQWAAVSNLAAIAEQVVPDAVGTDQIANFSILGEDIGDNGAAAGQVLKWNGSLWVPADDNTGGGSGGWSDDGTVVRLATSTDSVGIGTTTPAAPLEVVGPVISGYGNTLGDSLAGVGGGRDNHAASHAVVGGGADNSASGPYSTLGGGFQNKIYALLGTIGGGEMNSIDSLIVGGTIGGGSLNQIYASFCAIAGGSLNEARGQAAVIGGGDQNVALGEYSTVSGGGSHQASGNRSTIGGGYSNLASGGNSVVGGGQLNQATGDQSVVAGGEKNYAVGWRSSVGGGSEDTAYGDYSVVAGGTRNFASGNYSGVLGGELNEARGLYATVAGGYWSDAAGDYGTVAGGNQNDVSSDAYAGTVGGGTENNVQSPYSAVGGGSLNYAGILTADTGAFVGGGINNRTETRYGSIGGGRDNSMWGAFGVIGGGRGNEAGGIGVRTDTGATVVGGYQNKAKAEYAAILGGVQNYASARYATILNGPDHFNQGYASTILGGDSCAIGFWSAYSLAFGNGVYVDDPYRVILFDSAFSGRVGINRDDNNGDILHPLHIGTDNTNGNGAHLTAGGTWQNGSSRSFKDRFTPLAGEEVLKRASDLSVEAWNYKGVGERHIGPVAEDFVAAFDVGTVDASSGERDDRYLSPGDVAGVALICIQELKRENEELRDALQKLSKRLDRMEDKTE